MKQITVKLACVIFLMLFSLNLAAQQKVVESVTMADQLRADGKIWVVVAVVGVIFAGIIVFLISMERKITKLEKQIKP